MPELGVVILHHDRWPGVRDTIESVLANGVDPSSIVVVDNASRSTALDALRDAVPSITVLALPRNDGYAAGMNAGIRTWPERDVLLLTHDCVLEAGAISTLHVQLEDPTVGMAGPLLCLRSQPDVVFSAGGRFQPPGELTHDSFRAPRSSLAGAPTIDVDWLDGACLMVRRAVLDAVGVFDEDYFLYFEETDFSFRLRRAGWRIVCARVAVAAQEPSARPEALYVRNRLRFVSRQVSTRAACRQAAHELHRIGRLLLTRNPDLRRVGGQAARGLLGWVTGADPRTLYALSVSTEDPVRSGGRRACTGV